jgi:hypothetical protein
MGAYGVMTYIEHERVHVYVYIHVLLDLFKCCISATACILHDCGLLLCSMNVASMLFLLLPHKLFVIIQISRFLII